VSGVCTCACSARNWERRLAISAGARPAERSRSKPCGGGSAMSSLRRNAAPPWSWPSALAARPARAASAASRSAASAAAGSAPSPMEQCT